jgi:hypothetical protein
VSVFEYTIKIKDKDRLILSSEVTFFKLTTYINLISSWLQRIYIYYSSSSHKPVNIKVIMALSPYHQRPK